MCPDACSFSCLEALYLLFFLIKKVTKRIKAILPHMRDSAGFAIAHAQVPELLVRSISGVVIFFTWALFAQARKQGWSKQNLFLRSL